MTETNTTSERMTLKEKLLMVLGITLPLWLPFIYLALLVIEVKFTQDGPLSEMAPIALFVSPAFGVMYIFLAESIQWPLQLLIAPIYYFLGIFVAGSIGWILGCFWRVVACH